MTFYLLKFRKNWADEFDCNGIAVINEMHRIAFEAILAHPDVSSSPFDFGFGTNQGWDDEFTIGSLWTSIKKIEISEKEALFLKTHVLDHDDSFGIFPDMDYMFENVEDVGDDADLLIEGYYKQKERGNFDLFPK